MTDNADPLGNGSKQPGPPPRGAPCPASKKGDNDRPAARPQGHHSRLKAADKGAFPLHIGATSGRMGPMGGRAATRPPAPGRLARRAMRPATAQPQFAARHQARPLGDRFSGMEPQPLRPPPPQATNTDRTPDDLRVIAPLVRTIPPGRVDRAADAPCRRDANRKSGKCVGPAHVREPGRPKTLPFPDGALAAAKDHADGSRPARSIGPGPAASIGGADVCAPDSRSPLSW